jgi:hypothetical protein
LRGGFELLETAEVEVIDGVVAVHAIVRWTFTTLDEHHVRSGSSRLLATVVASSGRWWLTSISETPLHVPTI